MELRLEAPRELFMEAWCPEPDPLKALVDRLLAPPAPADRLDEPAEAPKLPPPALALPGREDEDLPTVLLTWPGCLLEFQAVVPLVGL